nr:MAG TPA: RimK-related lysine biosynthesis protein, Probable-dependent amine/thiol ligase family Amino-group [Caudoviricetes sp.]
MAEYIDRGAAVKVVLRERKPTNSVAQNRMLSIIQHDLLTVPAADVVPVVHGRWEHSRYEDCSEQFELVKCSQCNHEAYAMAFYVRGGNYCPNCGAKMNGGDSNALNRR